LIGSASNRLELREICITNTTSTACVYNLARCSAAGTPGTSLASVPHDSADAAATGIVKQVYTVTPTIGADFGYRFRIPATVGAGVIRTFDPGLIVPATAAAGIALVLTSGTGQLLDVDWTWAEL
jgi:hypothetical protein